MHYNQISQSTPRRYTKNIVIFLNTPKLTCGIYFKSVEQLFYFYFYLFDEKLRDKTRGFHSMKTVSVNSF